MRHLTPGELVDLAEDLRGDASAPHLATCVPCRRQLAELRAMVSIAADGDLHAAGDVPDPSPLFWKHLSARVRDAVRSEEAPARTAFFLTWPRAAAAAFGCAIIVAIAAALGPHAGVPGTGSSPAAPAPPVEMQNAQSAPAALLSPDDPSLTLVADYGRTLDWDELREQMAISTHDSSMDASVGELNADERLELHRLLQEELAPPERPADRS